MKLALELMKLTDQTETGQCMFETSAMESLDNKTVSRYVLAVARKQEPG